MARCKGHPQRILAVLCAQHFNTCAQAAEIIARPDLQSQSGGRCSSSNDRRRDGARNSANPHTLFPYQCSAIFSLVNMHFIGIIHLAQYPTILTLAVE